VGWAFDVLAVEVAVAQLDLLVAAQIADREDLTAGQPSQAHGHPVGLHLYQRPAVVEVGQGATMHFAMGNLLSGPAATDAGPVPTPTAINASVDESTA